MTDSSPPTIFVKNLTSPLTRLERGQRITKSDILELGTVRERDYTMLMMLKEYSEYLHPEVIKSKYFVMQECLQIIRKKILVDKLKYYGKRIQKEKLSLTSVLDLISNEKVLKPFWNEYTPVISRQLWLPTKTDCADLDSSLLTGSLKNQTQNSWFSMRFQLKTSLLQTSLRKTSFQSQQSLSQETMATDLPSTEDKENSTKQKKQRRKKNKNKNPDDQLSATKIRIYPTKEQKKTLDNWFGASRFIYNRVLSYLKTEFETLRTENQGKNKDEKIVKDILNKKKLRSLFVNNTNFETENTWMNEIDHDLRDEALSDIMKDYKTNFAKVKAGYNKTFNIRFKSKRDSNSISVLSKKWGMKRGFYSSVLSSSKLKAEMQLPKDLGYTSRLLKTEDGKYYLCIPKKLVGKQTQIRSDEFNIIENKSNKLENQKPVIKIISIDPGVRTFLTGYDLDGIIVKAGHYDIARLARLAHYKNKLQGRITKITNHTERYRVKKAMQKLSSRISNLVTDMHKKLAKWLCQRYNKILIPKLSLHEFKNVGRKTRAKMAMLRHCEFVDRLVNKSREYKACKVKIVREEYTSKTCGNCGKIKHNLYASKVFKCDHCNVELERDPQAARNIFIKDEMESLSFTL